MKPSPVYLPLAGLYGAGVALRNLLYEWGIFHTHRVRLPVVSVGNLSAGGTGKTPFVVALAEKFERLGLRTAVVARGYGRKAGGTVVVTSATDVRQSGDEAAMIARRIPGTAVVVDDSKRRAAQWVAARDLADVIVVDDGFQHRSLHRDLDIVLLTQEEVRTGGCLLPAGYRREPLAVLKRAHVVAVTGCTDLEAFRQARSMLAWLGRIPVIGARLELDGVLEVETLAELQLSGRRVVALSGIGNPGSFERTLHSLGAVVLTHRAFPDHHWYSPEDIATVGESARSMNAELVVTTEKDLVRIPLTAGVLPVPLALVRVRLVILSGGEILDEHVARVVDRAHMRN